MCVVAAPMLAALGMGAGTAAIAAPLLNIGLGALAMNSMPKAPSMPEIPKAEAAPAQPAAPTQVSATTNPAPETRAAALAAETNADGMGKTILSGPMGDTTAAPTNKKTLTGKNTTLLGRASDYANTFLTSVKGDTSAAPTIKKTLLGQ